MLAGAASLLMAAHSPAAPAIEDVHSLPAVTERSPELRERLQSALASRGSDYVPRTEHRQADGGPQYVNRLLLEDSPYLNQHAHNPVDWYPWGEEAFARARREGKAVFLSIGYSTCHWCHVMERESFENVDIARVMNQHFVCIKVDREQRPDIDSLYMTAVQLITGRGGWPMSSFLTPEGKPFFGGTYFPPESFRQLLGRVEEAWRTRREEVETSADQLSERVQQLVAARGATQSLGGEAIEQAVANLLQRFDRKLGGFGKAPKFPHEAELLFLEHVYGAAAGASDSAPPGGSAREVLLALDSSLKAMARGGLFDQIGGGFHRYSTDARWLVPHFEKMLYNQAQLARAYTGAYRLTGDRDHSRVARQTLDYVLAEMTSPAGLFYSATDADSAGRDGEEEEGAFFVWTPAEIREVLLPAEAELAEALFGVTEEGNFEGRNILHLPLSLSDFASRRGVPREELLQRVDRIRLVLAERRSLRPPPLRDDKILTSWNGMMITALAEAAETLAEPRYRQAAVRAAEALWNKGRRGEGRLWRVQLQGRASIPALQEDYAHLAQGLLAVFDLTHDPKWLERAQEIVDGMEELFWDADSSGFFMSPEGGDPLLLVRPKSTADGAIPSGNAVAVRVLARLAARTGELRHRALAEKTIAALSATVARYPGGFPYLLLGLDELVRGEAGPREWAAGGVVVVSAVVSRKDGSQHREVAVTLRIRDGWHVNSYQPLSDDLVATQISLPSGVEGWELDSVRYPEARRVYLDTQESEVAIYEGTPTIVGRLRGDEERRSSVPLEVRLQACDDRVCLAPETVRLELPPGDD